MICPTCNGEKQRGGIACFHCFGSGVVPDPPVPATREDAMLIETGRQFLHLVSVLYDTQNAMFMVLIRKGYSTVRVHAVSWESVVEVLSYVETANDVNESLHRDD